jgi:pyruvate formate lyase activating enzyme
VVFRSDRCIVCKQCETYCPQGAIRWADDRFSRDSGKCTKCGICATYCPSGALESIGKLVSVREVLAEIEKDNLFFEESGGGVTFSGGEPLSQPDFLIATLNACKDRRFHVVIETSGYAPKRVFEELIGSVDLFLFDIKHVASARHKHYTGASCRLILTNLSWVASMSKVIVRLPIIPGVNDDNKSIGQIGTLLASIPDICGIDIIAFHRMASDKYKRLGLEYQYNNVAPPLGNASRI